jgi:hypothetical protein
MYNLIDWIRNLLRINRMEDYKVWRVTYAQQTTGAIATADFFDDEEALDFFLKKKEDENYQTMSLMRVMRNAYAEE